MRDIPVQGAEISADSTDKVDQKKLDTADFIFQLISQRPQHYHVIEQMLYPEVEKQAGYKPVIFMPICHQRLVHCTVLKHKITALRIPPQR